MNSSRRRVLQALSAAAAVPMAHHLAFAQAAYPSRPIRVLVGFAPGGLTDIAARALSERMGKALGVSVVVENRPGAQTIIATTAAARAQPDGYTLTFAGTNGMILNPLLYNGLPYQQSDFRFLGSMGRSPMILMVNSGLGVETVEEFIELAKEKPGELACAHAGTGVINHLALLHFQARTGTEFQDVPYKGSGPALIDLMAGTVQCTFDFPTSALPSIQSGKAKALAVTADTRLSSLPDVPTMGEAGVDDFELYTRMMISGPAGMPDDVVRTLEDAVRKGVEDPSLIAQFEEQGVMVEFTPGDQLVKVVEDESAMWGEVIRENNVPKSELNT